MFEPMFKPTPYLSKAGKNARQVQIRECFPNLLFLKTALSRLDVGPAYYEDPVSSNPTYTKGINAPLLG